MDDELEAPPVADDRRSAIEAAFEAEEEKAAVADPPAGDPPPVKEPKQEPLPVEEHETETKEPVKETKADLSPPQSWKAPQRAKWDKLDPDIRAEVMRRERETTKVLGETAAARQLHAQFSETVQPYMARIQSLNIDAMTAVKELLRTDYVLATAPKAQRAQVMAKIIKDYGVDILELDNALAGVAPADPVDSRVEQLLQQRLAPFQQYIQSQQMREQERERAANEQVNSTVETMASDPKYPFFEDVRLDMADIVEIAAKRGVYLSLDAAYTRAIAMNPEVSSQVATQKANEAKRLSAQTANARAQKALNASVSVGGAPGGVPSGASGATDRRSVIAAAMDNLSAGR